MKVHRSWRNSRKLETELRNQRPEARAEFVASVAERVTPERRHGFAIGSRLAFSAALTSIVVGSLASFGGLTYAADGLENAASAVARVTEQSTPQVRIRSAAADQYEDEADTVVAGGVAGEQTQDDPPAGTSPATTAAPVVSTLPFTGLPLLFSVFAGILLTASGLALRRYERSS
jgi:hypothetical protein